MTAPAPYLIVTGHDFRSDRKANIHFISRELSKHGPTRVFSLGFSRLSRLKRDPRLPLWQRANQVETSGGVDCYLWRTLVHPFNLRRKPLDPIARAWFRSYVRTMPDVFDDWVRKSGTVILESGMAVLLAERVKRLNPNARLIYRASDDLGSIGCARAIAEELERTASLYDGAALVSMELMAGLPASLRSFLVPHGLDRDIVNYGDPSPYPPGLHAVSVGSMLFDDELIRLAAAAFPNVTFHIIGSGVASEKLSAPNITPYDEMPFLQTIPFIKHANFGIAPYRAEGAARYLAETSLKLIQYAFFGVPAICPEVAAGDYPWRFGYKPDNAPSVATAIQGALECKAFSAPAPPSWAEIAERLVNPPASPRSPIPEIPMQVAALAWTRS